VTRPSDEDLLAFLDGSMPEPERDAFLDALDADPDLAARLRAAAAGLDGLRGYVAAERAARPAVPERRPASPWWLAVAAAAATLVVAVPTTWWLARAVPVLEAPGATTSVPVAAIPEQPEARYVVVLRGRWPDVDTVSAQEARARAVEYWGWTRRLMDEGLLVAAGDLRADTGQSLGPAAAVLAAQTDAVDRPDFLVGVIVLRVESEEQARAIAQQCPHLRYGGSVTVRRVGTAFVTTPGLGDWQ